MLRKLVKWFFFAVAFTAVSFVVSALIYAGNQTEATFNTLAIIWCVIIFGSLFLVMLDPRQMAEDARARKAAQPKETPKTYKEPSKGLKIAGWISGIFSAVTISLVILAASNAIKFPEANEFNELHKGESFVCTEYTFKGETEEAKRTIEILEGNAIKLCYDKETGTLTRHISYKLGKKVSNNILDYFFPVQQICYEDPFIGRWIYLDIVYDKKTNAILRMEGDGFVFLPMEE